MKHNPDLTGATHVVQQLIKHQYTCEKRNRTVRRKNRIKGTFDANQLAFKIDTADRNPPTLLVQM